LFGDEHLGRMYDGPGPAADRPNEPFAEADDPVVGAVALLVLGAGLGSLFGLPFLEAIDFWVIFVIGFAVVVPLVSLLRGRDEDADSEARRDSGADTEHVAAAESDDGVDAALDRLRDRYARGELSEAQFERKLEALLETETPEDARERLERTDASDVRVDDTAREFERDG
jgi:uncharacterized membrane protein